MLTKRQIMEEIKEQITEKERQIKEQEHFADQAMKHGTYNDWEICIRNIDKFEIEKATLESIVQLLDRNITPWED